MVIFLHKVNLLRKCHICGNAYNLITDKVKNNKIECVLQKLNTLRKKLKNTLINIVSSEQI